MRFSLRQSAAFSASLALMASVSSAAVVFNQNFDDTGVFPTNVEIGATGDGGTTGGRWSRNDSTSPTPTPKADPAPAYSGDQAMLITRNGSGVTGLLGYRDDSSTNIASGTFTFQYSIYRNTSDASFSANVNDNTSTAQNSSPLGLYIDSTGDLNTMSSDNVGYVPRGVNIPQATWTQIRQVVDIDTGKYDLFATIGAGSETQILNDYPFKTSAFGGAGSVAFTPSGTVGNTFYVDDVFLGNQPVPEPMSGGILLGGGLLLLAQRRRTDR
ncbi:MAG: hypothetical protein IT447_00240 [Phycisphaerales bacterium]|jgi:hypothetical protein|nr:hypothetical protein [Phycisphaerales bacterium]